MSLCRKFAYSPIALYQFGLEPGHAFVLLYKTNASRRTSRLTRAHRSSGTPAAWRQCVRNDSPPGNRGTHRQESFYRRGVCHARKAGDERVRQFLYRRADHGAWRPRKTAVPNRGSRTTSTSRFAGRDSEDDGRSEKPNGMNPQAPPRFGDWLLNALLPKSDREVMAGDLAEEYSIRPRPRGIFGGRHARPERSDPSRHDLSEL